MQATLHYNPANAALGEEYIIEIIDWCFRRMTRLVQAFKGIGGIHSLKALI